MDQFEEMNAMVDNFGQEDEDNRPNYFSKNRPSLNLDSSSSQKSEPIDYNPPP